MDPFQFTISFILLCLCGVAFCMGVKALDAIHLALQVHTKATQRLAACAEIKNKARWMKMVLKQMEVVHATHDRNNIELGYELAEADRLWMIDMFAQRHPEYRVYFKGEKNAQRIKWKRLPLVPKAE